MQFRLQFRLYINTREWEARYTQSDSPTGWSEWAPLDRQEALRFIEQGWSFEII